MCRSKYLLFQPWWSSASFYAPDILALIDRIHDTPNFHDGWSICGRWVYHIHVDHALLLVIYSCEKFWYPRLEFHCACFLFCDTHYKCLSRFLLFNNPCGMVVHYGYCETWSLVIRNCHVPYDTGLDESDHADTSNNKCASLFYRHAAYVDNLNLC